MRYLDNQLLHPKTKKQVEHFVQKPVGSLLIVGEAGSGKLTVAKSIAAGLLRLKSQSNLTSYPYFFHVKKPSDKQDISIDTIREVIRFLALKTPGAGVVRRIVLIEDAEAMSIEAQNALLKILEEPNDDTVFLLTAPYELSLLPTIVSRCQVVQTYPVGMKQAASYYGGRYSPKKLETAWQLSQGNSALLEALLVGDDNHPLKAAVEEAKNFLKQPRYERLLFLERLGKNKEVLKLFLESLSKVLAALHHGALSKDNQRQAKKFLQDRQLVIKIIDALDKNANPKLVTLKLLLNLKI